MVVWNHLLGTHHQVIHLSLTLSYSLSYSLLLSLKCHSSTRLSFRRGLVPYAGVNNNELDKYLDTGARLDKPGFCPDTIYNLWRRCWSYYPTDRPTFVEVVAEIESYISAVEEKALQVTVPTDALYRNIANGRYYNETTDENEPAEASSSRQPVNNISKAPAEIPQAEATSL